MKKVSLVNPLRLSLIVFILGYLVSCSCGYAQIVIVPLKPTSIIMNLKLTASGQLSGIFMLKDAQINQIKNKEAQLEIVIPKEVLSKGKIYKLGSVIIDSKHPAIISWDMLSKLTTSNQIILPISQKGKKDSTDRQAGTITIKRDSIKPINLSVSSLKKENLLSNKVAKAMAALDSLTVKDTTGRIDTTKLMQVLDVIIDPGSGQQLPANISASDGQIYTTKRCYLKLGQCDLYGNPTSTDSIYFENGILFKRERVIKRDDTIISYVIRVLSWPISMPNIRPIKKTRNKKKDMKYVYDQSTNQNGSKFVKNWEIVPKFFMLAASDTICTDTANTNIDTVSKVTFTNFNIQSLPAKLRFGSNRTLHHPDDNASYHRRFDVSSGVSLGAAYGPRFNLDQGKGNFFLSLLIGMGVGTVNIDSSTTDNKCGSTKTAGAFTLYGGITFEYKQFQLGLFTGGDYLFGGGDINRDWNYRNQPWLGIGIGYSLFSNVKNTSGQTGQ